MKDKYEIICESPSSDGWINWVVEDSDGKKIYIEGAHEDLVKNLISDANQETVGNTAKLREALENCANMGEQIDCQLGSSDETVYAFRHERCLAHNISECARTALAEPPRNCDIGTAEEQAKRFSHFCTTQYGPEQCCASCPITHKAPCEFEWAQMPYEEVTK